MMMVGGGGAGRGGGAEKLCGEEKEKAKAYLVNYLQSFRGDLQQKTIKSTNLSLATFSWAADRHVLVSDMKPMLQVPSTDGDNEDWKRVSLGNTLHCQLKQHTHGQTHTHVCTQTHAHTHTHTHVCTQRHTRVHTKKDTHIETRQTQTEMLTKRLVNQGVDHPTWMSLCWLRGRPERKSWRNWLQGTRDINR